MTGIIALVTLNERQLVCSFPEGGGSREGAGRAFRRGMDVAADRILVVDFALTIAISIAAAVSAIVTYVPALVSEGIPIALVLTATVSSCFSNPSRRTALAVSRSAATAP